MLPANQTNLTNGQIIGLTISSGEWCFRGLIFGPLIFLYILVLAVIHKYPEDFQTSYYILITGLGFSDFIYLIYFLCFLFPYESMGYFYLNKSMNFLFEAVLLGCGWFPTMYLNIFIAINRLCAITFLTKYKLWFTNRLSILLICIAFGLGNLSYSPFLLWCGASRDFNLTFHEHLRIPFESCWDIGLVFQIWNAIIVGVTSTFVLLLYLISVVIIVHRLKHFSGGQRSNYMREVKLMFQGFFLLLMLILIEMCGYIPNLYPISEIVYCLYFSINPVIYLTFDSQLRRHLKQLLRRPKHSSVSPTNLSSGHIETSKV